MKFLFVTIAAISLISLLTVLLADTINGNVSITPNCGGQRTYAFYRTLEEKTAVEHMWRKAGFIPESWEEAPDSFKASGMMGFFCLRRMTRQELEQEHMLERTSVVTRGSSKPMNRT